MASIKKHLVFASEELYPLTAGGLGRFVYNAVEKLSTRYDITIIIPNLTKEKLQEFYEYAPFTINIITDVVILEFPYWHEKGKYYLAKILELQKIKDIHYIEFYDFGGSALETLIYRQNRQNELINTKIFIRHHMTIGEITEVETPFIPNHFVFYISKREQEALRGADGVLVQSNEYSTKIDNNTFVSYPPVSKLKSFYNTKDNIKHGENILYFGKIQQCKNIEVLLDALVYILDNRLLNFEKCILVGHIVPYSFSGYSSYHEELLARIPKKYLEKFLFLGPWDLEKIPNIAKNVKLAVIPSKIESFCLSAHELASFGIPLILKDLGVYNDFMQEHKHCEVFKESYLELAKKIEKVWNYEEDLKIMSSNLSKIVYPDFNAIYHEVLVAPKKEFKRISNVQFTKKLLIQSLCSVICSKNIFSFIKWGIKTKQWKHYIKKII
jgi:hypothetical protein